MLRRIIVGHALLTGLLTAAVGCGSVTPLNADGGSAGTGGGGRDAAMTTGGGGQGGGNAGTSGQAGATGQGGHAGVPSTGTGGQGGSAGVGAGFCNTDNDCVFRPGSCCDGTCAAKTDPYSPPTAMCNIACLAPVPSCGCVNHQCAAAPACAPSGGGACQFCPNGYLTGPGGCQTCECEPGDAGVDAISTSECLTTDTLPTDPAALHIYQLAQSDEHARLHGVVGQYVCGESPLYRGTFMASDNLGSIEPGATNGIVTGSVIASLQTIVGGQVFLTCDTIVTGGRALVVVSGSGAEARGIRLFQQPSDGKTTYASMVSSSMSTWSGTSGACDGCIADLHGDAPASIDVVATVFTGQYCSPAATSLQVLAGGHLTILQAPSWDDIIAFNQDVGATLVTPTFVVQGIDEVATVDGSVSEPAASTSGLPCNLVTPYHVDWYVNQQNLKLHGLRNFRIGASQTVCRSPV
jgi:hypothetical protein